MFPNAALITIYAFSYLLGLVAEFVGLVSSGWPSDFLDLLALAVLPSPEWRNDCCRSVSIWFLQC